MDKTKVAVIIPARLESTRLPNKIMLNINGKTVIQRVYENVRKSYDNANIFIAADNKEVIEHVSKLGANCVMTDSTLQSGTDRIAAALKEIDPDGTKYDIVVNFQGDSINVNPAINDDLIDTMVTTGADIVTVCQRISRPEEITNPSLVKIAIGLKDGERIGRCLYFSRSPIPFDRNKNSYVTSFKGGLPDIAYWHIGIYVYNAKSLQKFVDLPVGVLEAKERLEQLRALENGMSIYAVLLDDVRLTKLAPADINTQEEYQDAIRWIK